MRASRFMRRFDFDTENDTEVAAGYLSSLVLDPLRPERGTHVLLALACLLGSVAAVAASFLAGLPR